MRLCRWILPDDPDPILEAALMRSLNLPQFAARLLCLRNFREIAAAEAFLRPRLRALSDPFDLPDMDVAVDRILSAVEKKERIVLYGDYDVDGVTSLAFLKTVLDAYEAEVECFLPNRMEEGYGLTPEGIRRCLKECRPELLIALDCGTVSVNEIAGLQSAGVDVVVVDHHECKQLLPACLALVNPKRSPGFEDFCTVGLAFKVGHALLKRALGTVADLVPITGENRILVQAGLRRIETAPRPGIQALIEVSGARSPLNTTDISFKLAPRLNAAGRLGDAKQALKLLLTQDYVVAHQIASVLDLQNRERQDLERATFEQAVADAEKMLSKSARAIVVGRRGWHLGVLGIVASRLVRAYHCAAFVLGFDETGRGKGSGRSIEGVSLIKALGSCGEHLEQFGGHDQAAGLSMMESNLEAFRERFAQAIEEQINEENRTPRLLLDAELDLDAVDMTLLACHAMLEPFGIGNPQPLFVARGVAPVREPRVVREKHLLLQLRHHHRPVPAVYFGGAREELPRPPWDIAFRIERNEYQGRVSPQVQVQHVRACAD
jgi:single-stranded-DNA-specific exonuclease